MHRLRIRNPVAKEQVAFVYAPLLTGKSPDKGTDTRFRGGNAGWNEAVHFNGNDRL